MIWVEMVVKFIENSDFTLYWSCGNFPWFYETKICTRL